jgi:predicted Zn-dependent protease
MWMTIALLIQSAGAFELTESPHASEIRWDAMPIQWELDASNSPTHLNSIDQHETIRKAFATWEDVSGTDVAFEDVTFDANTNDNLVYWEDNWTADPNMLALTSTMSTTDGTIIGFKIALNAQHPQWTIDGRDGMDLQNALTHEVGHVLGLDHTHENNEATMHASAVKGEHSKRDLHWDDKEGIRYLYPETGNSLLDDLALSCSNAAAAPSLMLTLLPVAALVRRRRS